MDRGPLKILLVEDNAGDVLLLREAFRDAGFAHELAVVHDGVEALAYLRRAGAHGDAPRPDIVMLDLNLPRRDGREVLAEIKADAGLRRIPVLVLTSSRAESDIQRAYDLHANCYIVKPVDFRALLGIARAIHEFWVKLVSLPK